MNNLFLPKTCFAWLLAMMVAAVTTGCSTLGGPMGGQQASNAADPLVARPGGAPTDQLTLAERTFMAQAASRAMYELEVSRLAIARATSPSVRTYAQMLESESSRANSELTGLMRAKGVPHQAGLAADKATKLHRLSALRPSPNFDLGYVRVVGVEDHQSTIALYERARRDARDRDLKAWIDKTLPVLRNHLVTAQNLAGHLAG